MTESAQKKRRIFQIAKELNISHTEIMEYLSREGIKVASHMSPVDQDIYDRILGEFAKEKVIVDRSRKEKARREVELARRAIVVTPAKSRFDHILSIDEQRQLEKEDKIRDQKAKEEAELKRKVEEEQQRKKEEELKLLALAELKRRQEEQKVAAHDAKLGRDQGRKQSSAIGEKQPSQTKGKTRLKRVDMKSIEARVSQRRRRPGKPQPKLTASEKKSVEQTLRQTLASMGGHEKRRRPGRRERGPELEMVDAPDIKQSIKIHEFMSVGELANAMDVSPMDVISTCMNLGMMVTINQRLDLDSLSLLAEDFGFEVEEEDVMSDEAILNDIAARFPDVTKRRRSPIVTVMGHVDHGKTSLLDKIRDTNVVAGESGGITQHIGAYEVTLDDGNQITFLDTPGHAAFTSMRARGAQVTDIVILIVAADDAVMPQTIEAINHAKAAGVKMIVAINKIDKPGADAEQTKRQLAEHSILVEGWGGKYQCAEISAKTGAGISELMEKVLLEAEMLDLMAAVDMPAYGTVIESRLDRGMGAVATVLIQRGTLKKSNIFLCGSRVGRVRALQNERGKNVKSSGPAEPVLIQGFESVPQAGDRFIVFDDEREARSISTERARLRREMDQRRHKHTTLDDLSKQISEGAVRNLTIILKADVDGSLEAIQDSFAAMNTDEVAVDVQHSGVGNVNENDVLLAMASDAIVVAFRVKSSSGAAALAKKETIEIRDYDVIYDVVNDMRLALEGMLEPEQVETAVGVAEVKATFRAPKLGTIAGCYLKEGKAIRDAHLRVIRNGDVIHEGNLTSLRRFKDDVKEVLEGLECGIGVEGFSKFLEGDLIEIYDLKEVKRTLA